MDPLKSPTPSETKLHFLDYWRIIRIRKTVILAVFLLVVVTATLVTFILPKSYASTVRIKVTKDNPDIAPIGEQRFPENYDPYFIQTEFEVIQSQVVLENVAKDEELNLKQAWAQRMNYERPLKDTETIALLKRNMDLRPVRNTSLIEIRVYSPDPAEAAQIANKVAEVYRDYRLDQTKDLATSGIKALSEELASQDQAVKETKDKVDQLRKDLKISDAMAAADAPTIMMEADTLRKFEALRIDAETLYVGEAKRLSQFKTLSKEDLRRVLPRAEQDVILTDLLQRLVQAESEFIVLKKDYGPENPQILKLSELIADLNQKIDAAVEGIMAALETRVASLKARVDNLTEKKEEAQRLDQEIVERSRPYFDMKRDLQRKIAIREMMELKILTTKIDADLPRSVVVDIVDRAEPSLNPVKPKVAVNIILGVVVGLVVGVGLAFFIEYLDTSVKTIDDVERALQAPVLGVIPQNVGYLLEEGAESPHAEAYRVLRTNLLFSRKDDKMTSIVVISAGAGEGKSTTVTNLATVFAQSGQRVVIVDSDLRRPTLHKIFGVSNSIGLTSYLLKQNTLEEVIQTTSLPTLDFLPSGKLPSSSMGILNSKQMEDLIRELKQRYDFVFFDSPPMMGLSDAAILASEMDVTLQVIQYRRYPQPMTIRAKQMVEKVGGNLLGIVLNNINMSQDENYYYYSGYYHEYYSKEEDVAEADKPGEAGKSGVEIKQKY